jgi:hypothetical protein
MFCVEKDHVREVGTSEQRDKPQYVIKFVDMQYGSTYLAGQAIFIIMLIAYVGNLHGRLAQQAVRWANLWQLQQHLTSTINKINERRVEVPIFFSRYSVMCLTLSSLF